MRLEVHVLRELLVAFAMAAAFLFFLGIVGVAFEVLSQGDVPLRAALDVIVAPLLGLSEVLTPLAFLVAVLFTYGRMAAENEVLALQACGVHPMRLVAPALAIALGLGAAQHQISSVALPELVLQQDRILAEVALRTIRNLPPGASQFSHGDLSLRWKRRNGDVLEDVLLQWGGEEGERGLDGFAERVRVVAEGDKLAIVVQGFRSFQGRGALSFEEQAFYVGGGTDKTRALRDKIQFLRSDALVALAARAATSVRWDEARGAESNLERAKVMRRVGDRYAFEVHGRVARALCAFVFALVGAPIAIWLRRGTRLAALLVAAGIVFLGYHPLARLGEGLQGEDTLPNWLCAWSGTLGVGIAGVVLVARLVRR